MNPLRALFLTLSRTPPALMLVMIVGLAVLITVTITSSSETSKAQLEEQKRMMIERANAKTKAVYVVKDIPEGSIIAAEALVEKDLEISRVPQDAISNSSIAVGRRAKFGVNAGQILSSHDLSPMGISLDFNSRLPEGMRAVTFAVDSNSGVAGFVTPQSHVDVISMVGAGADTRVSAILSDVQVVAVGQQYEKEARGTSGAIPASSVTVAVSPEDTQKLIKAVAASKLYLSLRNDRDHTPIATVDVTSLFASPKKSISGTEYPQAVSMTLPEPPLPQAQALPPQAETLTAGLPVPPPLHEVEVWSGSKRDVLSLPAGK